MRVNLPVAAVLYMLVQAARGLGAAHRQTNLRGQPLGLVHRDISPQNILISFSGDVKLSDFGIAKCSLRRHQTAVGVIKGKFGYLSPEQARGGAADPRSDIFSLGIVLFELLTGEPFYDAPTPEQVIVQAADGRRRPLRSLRRSVPRAVNRVYRRCTAKRPRRRFQDAHALADRLEQVLRTVDPQYGSAELGALIQYLASDHWALGFGP